MEKGGKKTREKIGEAGYANKKCWLVKSLNYNPYKRCQYCESKFHDCIFLRFQLISAALISFSFLLFFLVEGRLSEVAAFSIFVLVIVFGYFFNKSTDRIIRASFTERKAKEALQELSARLEEKVDEQTKEIRAAYKKIEKAYELEKRTHNELRQLSEIKTQFLLSTQHHLRSPLTVVQGYLSMIGEGSYGEIPPVAKEKINASLDVTQKLINLVNELLDVANFQMNKGAAAARSTDMAALAADIVAELEKTARDKKIYLRFDKPALPVPPVSADPKGIREAVYNIVDNAIKYTQKGGVTISMAVADGKLRFAIADTGIGLNARDKRGLFRRTFERGDKAKEINANGKGIGLYLAGQMIVTNGGKIRAESEGRGKGTTFVIKLPLARGKNQSSVKP